MEQREIRKLVNRQRRFFYTGKTQHMAFREMALRRLQISIMAHEDEINRALRLDLGKSASEAYMCETGMVLAEISYMLKHMRQFARIRLCGHRWPSSRPEASESRRHMG